MKRAVNTAEDQVLPFREIFRVAAPLAVSSYVWTSIRPVINAALGHLPDPELAQAGFGVVTPIILLTCSPLWALQNVTLILPQSRADLKSVLRFGAWTTLLFTGLIILLTWTSIRGLMLQGFFSLSTEMKSVVAPALFLIVFEPLFLSMRSSSQGLLVRAKQTASFSVISLSKIALIALIGFLAVRHHPLLNGALLGTALFVGGEFFDGIFYAWKARAVVLAGGLFAQGPPDHIEPAMEGDPAVDA